MYFHTMRRVLAIPLFLCLTSCSTTSGHQPTVVQSGFDGSRVVNIEPHGGICPNLLQPCIGLGAQWSSANPNSARLLIQITDTNFHGIMTAAVNIDGNINTLEATPGTTDFTSVGDTVLRDSTRPFRLSLDMLRRMTTAKRVWVRVSTPTGSLEGGIVDNAMDSKALNALKRFMVQVDQSSSAAKY